MVKFLAYMWQYVKVKTFYSKFSFFSQILLEYIKGLTIFGLLIPILIFSAAFFVCSSNLRSKATLTDELKEFTLEICTGLAQGPYPPNDRWFSNGPGRQMKGDFFQRAGPGPEKSARADL